MNLHVPFNENQDCFTFEVQGACPEVSDEPARGGFEHHSSLPDSNMGV